MIARRTAWENHSRVPVQEAEDFEDDDDPPSSSASVQTLVMFRRMVGFLLADSTPALGIECLALVTGIGYDGSSMSEIAKRHAVTRAAVSKRCIDLCEAFGIPPVRAMRPEKNRARCREARVSHLAGS